MSVFTIYAVVHEEKVVDVCASKHGGTKAFTKARNAHPDIAIHFEPIETLHNCNRSTVGLTRTKWLRHYGIVVKRSEGAKRKRYAIQERREERKRKSRIMVVRRSAVFGPIARDSKYGPVRYFKVGDTWKWVLESQVPP